MPFGNVQGFSAIAEAPDLAFNDRSPLLVIIQQFLRQFGYLRDSSFEEGVLDEPTSVALRLYQERNSVKPTGMLEAETRNAMTTARCGLPDLDDGTAFSTRCAWERTNLTFAFAGGTQDTDGSTEFDAVRRAFDTWASAAPLSFTEVSLSDNADVVIDWRDANDPDLSMVGGVLAHADFPPNCSIITETLPKPIHFDDSEHGWSIGAAPDRFDVETVALHEIGHILGLQHTDVNGAVMFPSVSANFTLRVLQVDDLQGIQTLYPRRPPTVNL